jgi:AcrR family transcriptional regulator
MARTERNRLSRELVLAAATEIARDEGLDALSMRRLAERLDVWPMSIYTYFRDKDELLDALADGAVDNLELPSGRASWRNQIRALLGETRRALAADAGALSGRLPRALAAPRLTDAGLSILARAGFGEKDAASAWQALLSYTAGSALTGADVDDFERGLDALLDGLQARSL